MLRYRLSLLNLALSHCCNKVIADDITVKPIPEMNASAAIRYGINIEVTASVAQKPTKIYTHRSISVSR